MKKIQNIIISFVLRFGLISPILNGVILVFGVTSVASVSEASVMKTFGKANRLYKKGKLKAAAKILKGNVNKYPGHQPSLLLLGRIMYRSGNVRAAARYFNKIPVGMVAGAAAYEYGISMFETKRYNKAIKGFGKVGSKSKHRYLAQFYRGAAYMRNRQWQRAVSSFQRAKKLPSSLRAARRKLLRTARRRARAERQGQLTRSTYVIVPTPPPMYQAPAHVGAPDPAAPGAPAKPAVPAKPAPPPPPPTAKFTNSITPSLTVNKTSTNSQFHGFSDSESESQTTTFKISDRARYDMKPTRNGGQGHLQLGIDLSQANANTSGSSVKFVSDPAQPGVLKEEVTPSPSASTEKTGWSLVPEFGYPLTGSVDILAKYSKSESTVDGDPETTSGSQGPSGNIGISPGEFDVNIGFSATDSTAKGEVTGTSTTFKGDVSKSLENGLSLSANGSQTTYTLPAGVPNPASKTTFGASGNKAFGEYSLSLSASQSSKTPGQGSTYVTGAQSTTSITGSVSTSFDFGGSVNASFTSNTLSDYTKTVVNQGVTADEEGVQPSVLVVAQGTEQIVNGTFKIAPFDYIYGLVSYKQTLREFSDYSVPAMQVYFEATESDLSTKFVLEVGISKTF